MNVNSGIANARVVTRYLNSTLRGSTKRAPLPIQRNLLNIKEFIPNDVL
jgi:hypothetical protein